MAGKYGNDSWERPAPPPGPPNPPPPLRPPPGPPPGPPPPAGVGGSYRLDPAALNDRLKDCDNLLRQLADAAQTAVPMGYVEAPAAENASQQVTDQIKKSAQAYLDANQSMQDFLTDEQRKLKAALDSYTAAEQQAAANLKGRHA